MCGIAGVWKPRGLEDNIQQNIMNMMAVQCHRGPDGVGDWVDRDQGLAFGHTRLTLIDLITGAQPLRTVDGKYALVVNGEFYDYKRIRSELMTMGDKFRTKTDSEIALHLYQRHGLDMMPMLRGEFAFALYDHAEDRLILARDRFGIRPMFYHLTENACYFGSEIKSLLEHPDVPAKLDRKAALNQLMHTMVPGTTAFEGIRALEPGHMLILKTRGERLEVTKQRYWDLEFPEKDARDDSLPPEHHIEAIRAKLVEAVVHRLEADVPVGCYLSGGIDSCCILGMASGAMQSPVKAFTISFDSDEYDESAIAREMARSVNADQDIIHLKAEDLYGDNYVRTAWHAERTFYNTLGVAKWCMSRHVRDAGYKSVITGEGSDELFGGYPAFRRDMFLHGINEEPDDVRAELQAALEKSNRLVKGAILAEQSRSHPAFEELCGFTPSWIQPWLDTLDLARPLLADDVLDELHGYDPVAAIAETLDPGMIRNRHPLDIAQYTWSKTMLEGQILNWGGDRVDMANSMESRPAFLDHHVAETAVHVPPNLRIRGNIEKWVLREAVRGVLPEVLYRREKFAFMAPPAHTDEKKKARVDALINQYLDEGQVAEAGLLSPVRIRTFVDEYRRDTDPVSLTRKDALLNHLLCLQIIHAHLIRGDAVPGD
ncbi:MAG: asparagine synthase (glutamine-hydrolyzing) [Verrucomicrobiota bacterium]